MDLYSEHLFLKFKRFGKKTAKQHESCFIFIRNVKKKTNKKTKKLVIAHKYKLEKEHWQ